MKKSSGKHLKKISVKQWISHCFVCILIFSLLLSGAVSYFRSYVTTMRQKKEAAAICAQNVTSMLNHQWSLEDLSRSADSELYDFVRHAFRNFCSSYGMDYLYIYSIDPEEPSRFYYLAVASDHYRESHLFEELALQKKHADFIMKGEQALLEGSREIQQDSLDNKYGKVITWLAPYIDRNGEFRALIGMDYNGSLVWLDILIDFLANIFPIYVCLLAGLLILLFLVQRRIVNPIAILSDSMVRFAQDSRKKVELPDIPLNDEIGEMAATFVKMTENIQAYIDNIESLTQEQMEIEVQLSIARRIQNGLVPEKTNLEGGGFCISAMTKPAKTVGGDFYDCFLRGNEEVCIVIGDVSGKGISAAIYMAMTKTIIREKLLAGLSPAEALNQTNDELCSRNLADQFVTVFAAVLNPTTGRLLYTNAGHTYPVLLEKDPSILKPDSGIALGMFEDSGLKDFTLILPAGGGILFYTDGVTEAVNPQKQFFGTDRLLDAVKGVSKETNAAEDTLLRISQAVEAFCDGNEPFDDITMMALYCNLEVWHTLPVDLSSFEEIKKAVFSALGETPGARRVLLACDEILSNIVHYSGAENLKFECGKTDGFLRISFADDGIPFDPVASQIKETEFELLDSGGMGLGLVRQTASSMNYERKDDRNVLTLLFAL